MKAVDKVTMKEVAYNMLGNIAVTANVVNRVVTGVDEALTLVLNPLHRLAVDSNAIQSMHDKKAALLRSGQFRQVAQLCAVIVLMERVIDGEALTEQEYAQIDATNQVEVQPTWEDIAISAAKANGVDTNSKEFMLAMNQAARELAGLAPTA